MFLGLFDVNLLQSLMSRFLFGQDYNLMYSKKKERSALWGTPLSVYGNSHSIITIL